MNPARNPTVVKEESTLGNLVTDAMVWANREKTTENDERFMMAVHHSGGLRFMVISKSTHKTFPQDKFDSWQYHTWWPDDSSSL